MQIALRSRSVQPQTALRDQRDYERAVIITPRGRFFAMIPWKEARDRFHGQGRADPSPSILIRAAFTAGTSGVAFVTFLLGLTLFVALVFRQTYIVAMPFALLLTAVVAFFSWRSWWKLLAFKMPSLRALWCFQVVTDRVTWVPEYHVIVDPDTKDEYRYPVGSTISSVPVEPYLAPFVPHSLMEEAVTASEDGKVGDRGVPRAEDLYHALHARDMQRIVADKRPGFTKEQVFAGAGSIIVLLLIFGFIVLASTPADIPTEVLP